MIDEAGLRWAAAMRRGAFDAAHAISDVVLANRNPSARDDPGLPYHLRWVWDGRDLAGRDVLVRCYHGLGDTIQFARFLPLLRQRAARVTVEVQPELVGLLARMRGPDRLIPFQPDKPARPAERDVEIMELAHALRLDPGAISVPYLVAPPAPIGVSDRLNVGLCWRAGDWDSARSVPPAALRAACDQPRVHAWSLQYRSTNEEAEAASLDRFHAYRSDPIIVIAGLDPAINPAAARCRHIDARIKSGHDGRGAGGLSESALSCALPPGADVMAIASAIAGLDLIVTIDTMVAHLAGALGKQTWLLLRRECDWRWMERRTDSPWYPSMRLYRQNIEGDWRAPLERLAADLRLRARAAEC